MCIRDSTYHVAQAVFRAAIKGNVGPVIFEIARSEIGYTRPVSYTHLRAHETVLDLVCRLLLEKKKK